MQETLCESAPVAEGLQCEVPDAGVDADAPKSVRPAVRHKKRRCEMCRQFYQPQRTTQRTCGKLCYQRQHRAALPRRWVQVVRADPQKDQQFSGLTILGPVRLRGGKRQYKTRCVCQRIVWITKSDLYAYKKHFCWKCGQGRLIAGNVISNLTLIRQVGYSRNHKVTWLCRCVCGTEKIILANSLLTGRTLSCGCHKRAKLQARRKARVYERYYKAMCWCAAQRNIPVTITYEQYCELITQHDKCFYCGRHVEWDLECHGDGRSMAYKVDRKDSALGYHLDNAVVCCSQCNWAKRSMPWQEYIALGHAIAREHPEGV